MQLAFRWVVFHLLGRAASARFGEPHGARPHHQARQQVASWAFVEAVTPAVRTSSSLRAQYQRIKIRRGAKDARTRIARKLAELAWTVWTEQRCYEPR
jgi:hypothetical protein